MVAWENSREVGHHEKSLGLFPFHHRGQIFGIGPSIGMSPPGGEAGLL